MIFQTILEGLGLGAAVLVCAAGVRKGAVGHGGHCGIPLFLRIQNLQPPENSLWWLSFCANSIVIVRQS